METETSRAKNLAGHSMQRFLMVDAMEYFAGQAGYGDTVKEDDLSSPR